ncbi:hypothetical protein G3I40_12150 [Streptomyces sp. SID14478]|uniref:hypothetical protein n=1 Tax=Streptomyces sp. SID14478 TaxID=2706073 RepID=UPI0013D9514E|nr:hypothetical protein [Streptomyces sp. SID14478]NEB75968.1 hypothetical protein [Streptomyces sp. SID14478]
MNQSPTHRRRQLGASTLLVAVIALLVAAIVFVIASPGVPSSWWPQTAGAFAASSTTTATTTSTASTGSLQGEAHGQQDQLAPQQTSSVCDAVVGPAHGYCLGAPAPNSAPHGLNLAKSWPVGVLALGLTTLYAMARRRRGL